MPKKVMYGDCYNDSDTPIAKTEIVNGKRVRVWTCPIYTMWHNIIKRCYDPKIQAKFPTYIGVTISEEWKYFSNFRSWVLTQNYKDRDIDKDLKSDNNKIYSAETCIFVPHEINTLILNGGGGKKYAFGVEYDPKLTNPYRAHGMENNKKKHLGCFPTELDAHQAWQKHKISKCNLMIEKYSNESDLVFVLEKYRDKIQLHLSNNGYTI